MSCYYPFLTRIVKPWGFSHSRSALFTAGRAVLHFRWCTGRLFTPAHYLLCSLEYAIFWGVVQTHRVDCLLPAHQERQFTPT